MTTRLLRKLSTAALALCVFGLGTVSAASAQGKSDPRIGAWEELKTSTHYDSLLRIFEPLDNGLIRMQVNAKLLEANRWHVDFKCDGRKYRTVTIDGKFVGINYSCQRTGARMLESSFTYGQPDAGAGLRLAEPGWTSGTWTEEVSADGASYRTLGVTKLTNGQAREEHREFIRRN